MKKVLVTGCAGFIGSSLTEVLLARGYHVTGIDCFTDNYAHWMKQKNILSFVHHPRFRFIRSDLQSIDLNVLLQDIHYIFHEAALPGVRSSWGKNFSLYVHHNIACVQKLLEAIKESPVEKMVYASSSSVYGSMDGPTDETRLPAPYSPYGVSKLAGEYLCRLYHHNFGVPVVSLRYFTVYGPKQRPDMAFHRFIRNIWKGKPIKLYGDGRQTRDFTYIQDAVTANLLAAEKGRPGEIYNIGGSSKIELIQVIQLLESIMNRKAKVSFEPVQPGDPKHTWADISKARSELGYLPSFPIEKGLQQQVSHLIEMLEEDKR
ncbi:NAD-dependent epimerase/dehydratase family protein [Polycladomyces subterraneus]|uniref:NAD-dependent epimerase/dehydratase family protein n=1 Tax=Polycladomyces subterraneus TaxID=1016997 RepID=A0ABT8IMX5_9BACL|nr:NAD-dependent epimerase/dehydratase family protein [Polycladomyces subterraneus]MDN4594153.1 NAD-dependent epimerase/dehydratase family protein [Polycladomyces subterraneus]